MNNKQCAISNYKWVLESKNVVKDKAFDPIFYDTDKPCNVN